MSPTYMLGKLNTNISFPFLSLQVFIYFLSVLLLILNKDFESTVPKYYFQKFKISYIIMPTIVHFSFTGIRFQAKASY